MYISILKSINGSVLNCVKASRAHRSAATTECFWTKITSVLTLRRYINRGPKFRNDHIDGFDLNWTFLKINTWKLIFNFELKENVSVRSFRLMYLNNILLVELVLVSVPRVRPVQPLNFHAKLRQVRQTGCRTRAHLAQERRGLRFRIRSLLRIKRRSAIFRRQGFRILSKITYLVFLMFNLAKWLR